MNIEDIKDFFSKKPEIIYPAKVIEHSKIISVGKVFPITTLINGYIIAGLLITCNSEIFKHYKIGFPPPRPDIKFRMVNSNHKTFVIEVLLRFTNNNLMRLHLDPNKNITKHYLKIGLKNMIIAFHFYNQDNDELVDSITNLDQEEIAWFERNLLLAQKMKSNKKYDFLSKSIKKDFSESPMDKFFQFHNNLSLNVLFENSKKFFKMNSKKYHYNKPK